MRRDHQQWLIGKSLDTFAPMGPWAATADEVGDPARPAQAQKFEWAPPGGGPPSPRS
ncbi:fumarylacetoacetate hydrolase family protein [Streptomyces sp. NPDC060085]|uniref:fumarylacetoacetate hydrolase family protein n=1 Tax=Streptomyces sp. NPDC060085 TaxID=3347054 RepID=UPI00366A27C3